MFRIARNHWRTWRHPLVRVQVEELESRRLLSSGPFGLVPLTEVEPNDTLDLAQNLGDLNGAGQVAVLGNIGNGATGATDVDWFQFSLAQAARVCLNTHTPAGSSLVSTLSLYDDDPWAFTDPEDAIGHRLLAQSTGTANASDTILSQSLAAGTYWVAVSGAGNRWFHPYIAGSGDPGSTGDYELSLQATDLTPPPTILSSTPGDGEILDRSPLVIRIDYSTALDTNAIDLSATQLLFSPTGDFSDPNAQPVALSSYNFSTTANELQLTPAAALRPGYYGVFLADGSSAPALRFQVAGIEGGSLADDSPATAHALGDLTNAGLVQITGAIGDDPAYDPSNADPLLANPAADVDLYHSQISGPGRYAFVADVFASRIGSRLDPGVSLYRWDPSDQQLHFIDGNDNTRNDSPSTNGMLPLYTDAVLFSGLTAGDYYVAVSGGGNTPELAFGTLPGSNGIFDPNVSHSGTNGATVGNYVLNLAVRADNDPPQVVAVTPQEGTTLGAPPTQITIQFSESINLQALAYQAFQQTSQSTVSSVYVEGEDGTRYYPRLESYDDTTHEAHLLMLDGLANGSYRLHLSGPLGLADFAGNELVGDDISGDYVVSFTVAGPERGTAGNPLLWSDQEPNDDVTAPQDLGLLFPHELQAGVTVVRDFTANPPSAPADSADFFRFQVLQNRTYVFLLEGAGLPPGVVISIYDAAGNPVPATVRDTGDGIQAQLDPGFYVVSVSGWTPGEAGGVAYQLHLVLGESGDNPPPLTVGPRPASATTLVSALPLSPSPVPSPAEAPVPLLARLPAVETPVVGVKATIDTSTAAFLVSLLVSPLNISVVENRSTASLDAGSSSLIQRPGSPGPFSSLLATLGAGPIGGVEEVTAGMAQPDTPRAPVPSLLLTQDLLPQTNPLTNVFEWLAGLAEPPRVLPRAPEPPVAASPRQTPASPVVIMSDPRTITSQPLTSEELAALQTSNADETPDGETPARNLWWRWLVGVAAVVACWRHLAGRSTVRNHLPAQQTPGEEG
jgi:methionine-rich copper-binding protein CopC